MMVSNASEPQITAAMSILRCLPPAWPWRSHVA
jgi:hypothetical protein